MTEDLLHFIWKYRLYNASHLKNTDNEKVQVVQTGTYNTDAGPDFINARIKIGDVLLAGNVELHINQRDWFAHQHNTDKGYNNVVLHVVYESGGRDSMQQSGYKIPVLSLKDYVPDTLLNRYEILKSSYLKIPCEQLLIDTIKHFQFPAFFDRLVIERLQAKVAIVQGMLADSINNWDQVAFQMVAMYFGGSLNKQPFTQLATSLPLALIHKHRPEQKQIEALLFGQAGMLAIEHDDEYPRTLKREYNYLSKLHSLTPIDFHIWKFFRIRPAAFPTVKVAQLAAWLVKEQHPMSSILSCKTLTDFRGLFEVQVNPYWYTHFQFDKPVKSTHRQISNILTDVLLINAIVPLLFSYGQHKGDESLCQRAIDLLSEIPAENNNIIRMWQSMEVKPQTAYDSQALLQLYNQYCCNKKCLSCQIGHKLLSPVVIAK